MARRADRREAGALVQRHTMLLAVLVPVAMLGGCMVGSNHVPAPVPAVQGGASLGGGVDASANWWLGLGDAPLSGLIERAFAGMAPGRLTDRQVSASAGIARSYIDLRTQQTMLVLLAEREDLDIQLVTIAGQRIAGNTAAASIEAAQAQLERTHADQARVRADVAELRNRLAALTGSSAGALDSLPGGPIPLPPTALVTADPAGQAAAAHGRIGVDSALGRFDAARAAAGQALSQAAHARSIAQLALIRAGSGTLAPEEALDEDRRALDALQAEEQARAAMTQAYVALVESLGPGSGTPGR
jgi:outer membrane protein TolC